MRDLPEGYSIDSPNVEDIQSLISVDKAASALFAPTGLIKASALNEHVPADILEAAIVLGDVFVARTRHQWPCGFALVSERGRGLYLDQVSVHPDHGQRGIGRALVARVLREAEARKLPHVTLSTFRDLPWNGPFYRSMAFKELPRGRLKPFMLEIEAAQAPHMNIHARCFMMRKIRPALFRLRRPV